MITALTSERWKLARRGTEDGLPMVEVTRITTERVITWRLVERPNGWHKVGDYTPHFKGFRRFDKPMKLSNARMDLELLSFAEHGHGGAYA